MANYCLVNGVRLTRNRGLASVSVEKNQFVVDNGSEGSDIHCLETGAYIRTLYAARPLFPTPKTVVYAEGGRLIVAGSDTGIVHLYDPRMEEPVECLRVTEGKVANIPTVAVSWYRTALSVSLTKLRLAATGKRISLRQVLQRPSITGEDT